MGIEEKIASLKAELADLKPKLAEHDADAFKRAGEILDTELPEQEAKMAEAKSFADTIARIGGVNAEKGEETDIAITSPITLDAGETLLVVREKVGTGLEMPLGAIVFEYEGA